MNALDRYVRTIRNAEKRRYAADYVAWCRGQRPAPNEADYRLGYMAFQAVWHRVGAIRAGR